MCLCGPLTKGCKEQPTAALPTAGKDWAWRCLCPHCLCLCSLAVLWDTPAREVMKYIYSLHCSWGVLVTLTHLCVSIHTASNVWVQLWINRTAHVSYCQPTQSRAERPDTETCSWAVCVLQFLSANYPASMGAHPYPKGHKLDLKFLSDLIEVCLGISIWNQKGLLADTSFCQDQRKFNLLLLTGIASTLLHFSLLKDIWGAWSQWTYNTDTVRVTVGKAGCPSQESFQEFLRGYSEVE